MSCDLLDQCANQTLHRFMMKGRSLGLVAGYHAFQRAAELEDRCERLKAAAWLVFGRVIIVALCSPPIAQQKNDDTFMSPFQIIGKNISKGLSRDSSAFALASEIRQQACDITNELGVLVDAGRHGGSISAESVYWLAQNLNEEIRALQRKVERLILLSPEDRG